jgi:subtilisin family serine protease
MRKQVLAIVACLMTLGVAASGASSASGGSAASGMFKASASGRYIVIAPTKAAYNSALSAARTGNRVALSLAPVNAFTLNASASAAQALAKSHHVKVIPDRIESLVRPDMYSEMGMTSPSQVDPQAVVKRLAATGHTANPFSKPSASPFAVLAGFTADPAFSLGPPSPMSSIEEIGGPAAWTTNGGDDDVLVAVADTGLDYTHSELDDKVIGVTDISATEGAGVEICKDLLDLGVDDQDLAALTGGPADGDFNGHGSWIGGNIAGEVNGNSVNGIAPGVSLVAVKISQWCGSAFDSEIMSGFLWAAEHGVDVVSISFGGYLDKSDPFQAAAYDLYESVVAYATKLGTTIVSSAGNEHVRIGTGGKVMSHGPLSVPPGLTPAADLLGTYEVPGGIKGVVDVSSTSKYVMWSWPSCPTTHGNYSTTGAHPFCKLQTDLHQPFGAGQENQLAYYSNYGPRIDVAGPGGARKYNLPAADRGGTEGWPFTGTGSYVYSNDPGGAESQEDGFNAWEDFSITSNYAVEIPCVVFDGSPADPATEGYYGVTAQTGFDDDQCYSTIQGTSMAAPHASATLALIASAHPELRFDPKNLIKFLKKSAVTPAKSLTNATPPLSPTDTSNTDLTGLACPGGYCHLGGKAIKAKEAFGAGLVNAAAAVAGGVTGP